MKRLILAMLFLLGCSSSQQDTDECGAQEPPELGRQCAGDGECGSWLVCDETCDLPPTVKGTEGQRATLVSAGGGETSLRVEVARSDVARTRGLSYRPCMQPGWGLLIEFPSSGDHLLTTQSTRFAIDMAMTGVDGVVHTVHWDAPAAGKALYGATQPYDRVLETAAGEFEIEVGDRLLVE